MKRNRLERNAFTPVFENALQSRVKLTSAMQSIWAARLSIEQAACSGVRVCKTGFATQLPGAMHLG